MIVIVLGKDALNDGCEQPKSVFGGGHNKQKGRRDQIHALAVPDERVTPRVGEEDFVELADTRPFAEENIIGQCAANIHLNLGDDVGVVVLARDEIVIVTGDTESCGATALGPNF